ncbi:YkgJ family cysteine cluster protein [Ferribacterium limneticum]|uniref:YkgJ family cysteine cluster protein n=1 Tax=Ferribacterium limneticum TaxID=76259 RepID=UPI001CF96A93|nr:YkgJ family cysteine cluster protein [Ferribacterium limneticum]UCV29787.1 YkgJ family cysteine cluster protein [Ferribacterium limneticum]UCV33706.1 YkgJ family cysteine cluster protein [Ferribacterium limneticum]
MSVCQTCGACCASFRVDFHPVELAGGRFAWGQGVPVEMTVPVTPTIVRLCGTDAASPRCIALNGEVGKNVGCGIYYSRPSPCREFDTEHAACTKARQRFGLPPLPGQLPAEAGTYKP